MPTLLAEKDEIPDALDGLMRHSLLSSNQEIELAKRIERGDLRAKELLINHNYLLARKFSRPYLGNGVSEDDLFMWGVQGLIRAAELFDWRKGFRFSTYASWWIRQAAQRAVENTGRTIRLPVHKAQQLRKLRKAQRTLAAERGYEPTSEELAKYLDWPLEQVEELIVASEPLASLDRPYGEDSYTSLGETLPDEASPSTDEQAELSLRVERLYAHVESLPGVLPQVIKLRFGLADEDDYSYEKLGEKLNVSKGKAKKLVMEGLDILQEEHGDELGELFNDQVINPFAPPLLVAR